MEFNFLALEQIKTFKLIFSVKPVALIFAPAVLINFSTFRQPRNSGAVLRKDSLLRREIRGGHNNAIRELQMPEIFHSSDIKVSLWKSVFQIRLVKNISAGGFRTWAKIWKLEYPDTINHG